MKTTQRAVQGTIALAIILAALAPLQDVVYIVFLMTVMYLAIFAASVNLLLGWGGLLSFGHAAFFGTAAYVTVYARGQLGLTPELALLLSTLVAATLGLVIGWLAVRRHGIAFAMITLALAQMVYFIAAQWRVTGGDDGLRAPRGALFGALDLSSDTAMYYFVLVAFLLAMLVVYRVVNSPFGDVLGSVRQNEARAMSLGYDVRRVKLTAFVVSAALAGFSGGLKGLVLQLATLSDVHWHTSGEVLVSVILGGVGTLLGPLVGALVISGLHHHLTHLGALSMAVTGAIFMLCVMAFRRGIVGELLARWPRRA
jgi:branched-chain amino acid transport system permease protein